MANILYGVGGEGMGHAIRSKPTIQQLMKKHNVLVVTGDRAYKFFQKNLPKKNVQEILSLNMVYVNNEVSNFGTLKMNLKRIPQARKTIKKLNKIFLDFKPDIVISDFEFFTNKFAKRYRVPLISLDNICISVRCNLKIARKHRANGILDKAVILAFAGGADYYIITTFFYPEKKNIKKRTYLVPPIVREEIQKLQPMKGNHVLVYQTSNTYHALLPTLKKVKENFVVYGLHKNLKDKNLILRDFNESAFLNDIANCKAIITNGGFTLMSEAIYLKKPILSIPVKKQYEQIVNATYVERMKYGEFHEEISKEVVESFLKKLPIYEKTLSKYSQEGNQKLFNTVDNIIDTILANKKRKSRH
jgi:uncharacterized protein (TIGR00661 family)